MFKTNQNYHTIEHFKCPGLSVHQKAKFNKAELLEGLTVPRQVEKRPAMYEPEGSLLCSQETASCPGEPDQSSPRPHSTSCSSILILHSQLCLGLPRGLIRQVSPPKPRMHLSSTPYVSYGPAISFFLAE